MKWLKKINQLFTHKELRDDYEEQYIDDHEREPEAEPVDEAPIMPTKKPVLHVTETPKEVVKAQKDDAKVGAFRFPLIPDDEEDDFFEAPAAPPPPEKREERAQQQKEKQQDPLNVVLEPEPNAPGIRELLAQRKKGHRPRTQLFTPPPVEQHESHVELPAKEVPIAPVPPVQPFVEQRRFVPTSVPSPVFGYGERTDLTKKPDAKEPSTINELLDKHRHEFTTQTEQPITAPPLLESRRIDVANKSILQTVESAYEELSPMRTERPAQLQEQEVAQQDDEGILEQDVIQLPELSKLTTTSSQAQDIEPQMLAAQEREETEPVKTQQPQVEEAKQSESPLLLEQQVTNEKQCEEPRFEELDTEQPTAHVLEEKQAETIHVQQAQVEELVIQNVQVLQQEVAPAEQVVAVERKERARPFNVVMLKSDKKKLEEKQALQAVMQYEEPKAIMPAFIAKEPLQKETIKVRPNVLAPNTFEGETIEEERLDIAVHMQEEAAETSTLQDVVEQHMNDELPSVVTTAEADDVATKQVEEPQQHSKQHDSQEAAGQSPFPTPQQEQATIEQAKVEEEVEEVEEIIVEPNPVRPYEKPTDAFLVPPEENLQDTQWMEEQGERLVEALSHFQVKAQIESIVQGPAVTQFEITVEHGTKVSKVRNLSDDLKLALAARDIRIQAPIPGKNTIGIEIPNRLSRAVRLSEVTCSDAFTTSTSPMEAALGLDLTGAPVTIDLRKMPHGLIAGATGSGKSVCINSILVSLLYKAAPHELKLLLIDPKMVELAPFNHIPHLVSPVITDVKAATAALKWAVDEMERRYQLFAHMGVRDLERYNKLADKNGQPGHKLPYLLIVIDELADLMMMAPHDVEEAICRIAQKARACGIHLIVATQRPSVDVITGLIKSNIPTRIAFMVSSQIDSRTILDSVGAERLLGRGDMLYLGNGQSAAVRLQGTFVTDDEIEDIIEHVRAQGEPEYVFKQEELLKKTEMTEKTDELFEEVCRFVYERKSASTSAIQRHYSIGYSRAARLVDMLEAHGFVSEAKTGNKPRDVYITQEELENMF